MDFEVVKDRLKQEKCGLLAVEITSIVFLCIALVVAFAVIGTFLNSQKSFEDSHEGFLISKCLISPSAHLKNVTMILPDGGVQTSSVSVKSSVFKAGNGACAYVEAGQSFFIVGVFGLILFSISLITILLGWIRNPLAILMEVVWLLVLALLSTSVMMVLTVGGAGVSTTTNHTIKDPYNSYESSSLFIAGTAQSSAGFAWLQSIVLIVAIIMKSVRCCCGMAKKDGPQYKQDI